MAKKYKKSESATYSYPRVYSLVLWNTGEEDHGSTFAVLSQLVNDQIDRIDRGEADDSDLHSLMIIRDQLEEEFEKGRSDG